MVTFDVRVLTGNSNSNLDGIEKGMKGATGAATSLTSAISQIGTAAFAFNNIKSAMQGIADDFKAAVQPGIEFNDQMQDLQAITGVSDAQLKIISAGARDNAKAFGVDASAAVESYKLILSQLGPEIANNTVALSAMGNNAAILSKQLGGDMAGATGILTTAMNQYDVSLKDPIQASKVMGEMMNIMAASAKEGSAELPQIKGALEQAGLMAKTSNVTFAELNATIQVLDKAGKKGAEGGVAIRNVLAEIGQGARMPKMAAAALDQYGVSVAGLADKNKTFAQRLELLKPLVKDSSAMTAIFGKENVAAAIAMVQSTDEIARLNKAVIGTNTAVDMAHIKMTSYKEVMARVTAQIKDWGISIFNAAKPLMPFMSMAGGAIKILGDFGMAANGVAIIADTKFGAAIGRASMAVWGFVKNLALGALGLIRQGAVMAGQAVVSVVAYIAGLVGATAAQWALNIAMYANPIGIIVLGIAAAVAAIVGLIYYWDEIWAAIKAFGIWIWEHHPFKFLLDLVEKVFPGFKAALGELWDWIKKKFEALLQWFTDAWKKIKGFFTMGGDAKDTTAEQAAAMQAAVSDAVSTPVKVTMTPGEQAAAEHAGKKDKHSKTSGAMASNISGGGNRPTTIHLTIHKLQDQIVVHTTNLQTGAKEAGRQIVEEILMALNSVNGKAQLNS